MTRRSATSVFLLSLIAAVSCQTPVIGGSCKLGTSDVQIGGKQTQFFLKCEAASDSADGEGVWVVKSRAASPPAQSAQPVPTENIQPQARPMKKLSNPNICEQDNGAREQDSCAVSATCLQAHSEYPTSYLQCDQTSMRWVKKSCQDGFLFNFEQQTCIIPKRTNTFSRQQVSSGLVCTFASCSSSNPCNSGTCNNGYCCSSGGSSSSPIIVQAASSSSNCVGCQQSPQIISIPTCPGGSYSVGTCSSGYCSPGYSCVSGSCCPSYTQPSVRVYTCPSGSPAVGACMSGSCSSGYSCVSGSCCPSTTTTNPFVCPDGTQAAGGCVNGQCGTGYTCSNGLCCAGTSSSVRCLDGSEAVGACIPSCTGNACGQTTVSYYCGTGYTCTTGNICCAINSCPNGGDVLGPTVNGLCPTGYTAQGSVCCSSAACSDGSTPLTAINNQCIAGYALNAAGTGCCPSTDVACDDALAYGDCITGGCAELGYACDTATQTKCCPVVQYNNPDYQLGPGVGGLCPVGYAIVFIPGVNLDADGTNPGTCVNLQSIPGICDTDVQSGPCQNGACGTGFTCFIYADVCCPTAAFRKLRPGQRIRPANQKPVYGRPLHSYMPRMNDQPIEAVEKIEVASGSN